MHMMCRGCWSFSTDCNGEKWGSGVQRNLLSKLAVVEKSPDNDIRLPFDLVLMNMVARSVSLCEQFCVTAWWRQRRKDLV